VKLILAEDPEDLAGRAADFIAAAIAEQPGAALVVATGNTPLGAYRELARRRSDGRLDASRVRVFQLDEYLEIAEDDPRSLYGWMRGAFLEPLGVPDSNVVRLRGDTPDPAEACASYVGAVRASGGLDLVILGLGPNGHLGFNEPPSGPDAPTRVVDLTEASVESNAGYWGASDRVPRRALTAGMDLLLAARRTLLLVSGAHKRDILAQALAGPATPWVPASYLRQARDSTVIADRAAWPSTETRLEPA
jgi:glucosamine-6-phosphate deaminase